MFVFHTHTNLPVKKAMFLRIHDAHCVAILALDPDGGISPAIFQMECDQVFRGGFILDVELIREE